MSDPLYPAHASGPVPVVSEPERPGMWWDALSFKWRPLDALPPMVCAGCRQKKAILCATTGRCFSCRCSCHTPSMMPLASGGSR